MKPNDQGHTATGSTDDSNKAAGVGQKDITKARPRVGEAKPASSLPVSAGGSAGRSGQTEEQTFDRWLTRKLTQLYGDLRSRPVPDSLLRIIERHRRKKS